VLPYIGFDGISTLSEEAENPRRNIMLATVLTCVVIGLALGSRSVRGAAYLARVGGFPNVDTRYVHVVGRAWGPLFAVVGFTFAAGEFWSGMARN